MNKILTILICAGLIFSIRASAEMVEIPNPLGKGVGFEGIINALIDFIFSIAVVLVPLMVIVGGFMIVTSAGNTEQIAQGKKIIMWTVIGLLVMLLSKGLVQLIETLIGV